MNKGLIGALVVAAAAGTVAVVRRRNNGSMTGSNRIADRLMFWRR